MGEEMIKRSRAFIERACLVAMQKAWPANNITRVEIERLPPGAWPNWKLGKIHPNPPPIAADHIRQQVENLPQIWALEDE